MAAHPLRRSSDHRWRRVLSAIALGIGLATLAAGVTVSAFSVQTRILRTARLTGTQLQDAKSLTRGLDETIEALSRRTDVLQEDVAALQNSRRDLQAEIDRLQTLKPAPAPVLHATVVISPAPAPSPSPSPSPSPACTKILFIFGC